MMYQARIVLSRESAFEALQMLCNGKNIANYHNNIMGGSINYEKSGGRTTLELELTVTDVAASKIVSVKTFPKKDSEDASVSYKILEEVYQSMRARHGENITPLGIIGPSEHIELYYYVGRKNANRGGDTTLRLVDINHICLN